MPTRLHDFLLDLATIDPAFSPAPLWWWSGEKLRIDKLCWQMDQLKPMGVHQLVVINLAPSCTMFATGPDDPPFFSEEWWTIFSQVCDHAKQIGTKLWFYDQLGFSGASFQSDLAAAHPDCIGEQLRDISAEGTGDLSVTCPTAGVPLAAYVTTNDSIEYLKPDRTIQIHAKHPSRLRLVYTLKAGFNFFSPQACSRLIGTVHGEFARRLPDHLGSTIIGSFQDELADLPTWGDALAQSFPQIHHLFEPGDAASRRTRLRYHSLRADLAEEAFFKPLHHWHQSHNLRCGFDQQSPAREARVLGSVQKYADYLQTHRWYSIPGSDHHGNAKLHASLAFMHSHPRVWLEGFHSTGWGGTLADTFDWLLPFLQSGANFYNPHAVYYSTQNGQWEWAAPSTCWRQPYAIHYKTFADTIARLTRALAIGVHQADVAVLFPSATVQAHCGPTDAFAPALAADKTLHETIGSMRWHQSNPGPLDAHAIPFHILDEPTIQSATIANGALNHRDCPMHTVILPHVTMLHDATLAKLIDFANSGGRIIAIGSDQIETPAGLTAQISALPNALFIESANQIGQLHRTIASPLPTLHRRDGALNVLFIPAVAGMATVVKWDHWFAPVEHTTIVPDRYQRTVELTLPPNAKNVWRFDPTDGASRPVPNGPRINLGFESAPFAVLIWSDDEPTAHAIPPTPRQWELLLADTWQSDYDPRFPLPQTTDLQWTGPSGKRQPIRATFGVRARRDNQPIIYSPLHGILQDPIHVHTLGPKGRIPEEFIDLGKLTAGQRVIITTAAHSLTSRPAVLAIGANAQKSAAVNGRLTEQSGPEYLWMTPVELRQGENPIDLNLTARRDGSVRLFWALLDPPSADSFRRPERLLPPQPALPGSLLIYRKRFAVFQTTANQKLKLSAAAQAALYLDDRLIGRQGGFDPYRPQMRGQIHLLPDLTIGHHELRVELIQPNLPAPLLIDSPAVLSDATWTVNDAPVAIHDRPEPGDAAWLLIPRPHPLTLSPTLPPLREPAHQHLQWTIPPGAKSMTLPLADHTHAALSVAGQPLPIASTIPLPPGPARHAELQISSRDLAGGLLLANITYTFAPGQFKTGSWLDQGLRSYSGAIHLQQTFHFQKQKSLSRLLLDLGRVRGTVAATLNGHPAPPRCLAPYHFDLTKSIQNGPNRLELLLSNTLANRLSTTSPTSSWSPDQLESGLFGPVRLIIEEN